MSQATKSALASKGDASSSAIQGSAGYASRHGLVMRRDDRTLPSACSHDLSPFQALFLCAWHPCLQKLHETGFASQALVGLNYLRRSFILRVRF